MARTGSVLLATTDGSIAGAEKIILSLRRELTDAFETHLAIINTGSGQLGPEFRGSVGGPLRILFGRYSVIHSHLFHTALLVRLRRFWDPKFLWVHTIHYENYESQKNASVKEWLDRRFIFPWVDRLVGVSKAVAESFGEFPSMQVIVNGLEMQVRPRPAPTPDPRGPVIGCAAMFRAEKAQDDLIRAVAGLVPRWPGIRLRLAGTGALLESCRNLARELGVEPNVEFLGRVENMDAFYASLDVYCQPSRQESFCLAAHEAIQYALPLVLANVGNLRDFSGQGRFAKLVRREEADFPAALGRALIDVTADLPQWSAKSKLGYEAIRRDTDPRTMALRYARLYETAFKGQP